MREPMISDNEEQNHQRPPLSPGRIAGELFAGMALGLVASLPVAYVIGTTTSRSESEYAFFGLLAIFGIVLPPLNIVGSVVGVFLVGRIGKQTGSFLATLVSGLLGGLCILPMLGFVFELQNWLMGMLFWIFVALLAPTGATIGFNLTRRYTDTFDILGTVVYKNLEGGFFAIDGDDGSKYDPISLPESFRKDGLRVKATARLRKHAMSLHLYGSIIEVVNIARQ